MTELEQNLFDGFKRLDVLCRDMFASPRGVGEYLSLMEQTPTPMRRKISTWEKDYSLLKRVCRLKNQIAHEVSVTDCSISDIKRLEDFYQRILRQQDPLAVVQKLQQEQQRPSAAQKDIRDFSGESRKNPPYKANRHSLGAVLFATALVAIFLVVLAIFFLQFM